jgi:hypothetical protein
MAQAVIVWNDFKAEHPPVNGRPCFVCFVKEVDGSYVHVGRWGTTSTGKPLGVIAGKFAYDLPEIAYWSEIILPWDHGYPKPLPPAPAAM